MRTKCEKCGQKMRFFGGVSFFIQDQGREKTVSYISGWRCVCGEVVFDQESAKRYAEVSDEILSSFVQK